MALVDDLRTECSSIFRAVWTERDGTVVPAADTVKLSNDGVNLEGTVLYADLSESTKLVDTKAKQFSAEVYKSFLHCAAKIVKAHNGVITAYDGDRIMAVFVGRRKNTDAVKTGLKINWAVKNIVTPEMKKIYTNETYVVRHTVGIDTSQLMAARIGVRGDNDLVWVGRAANWAAKLCTLGHDYPTWITKAVYDQMLDEAKFGGPTKQNMWEARSWTKMNNASVYRSGWTWSV
ncbi:adenylate/guanylate cyclase domain-containing protein [Novosphingobium gossypii]|uniref:adenylate/guanylate cyclase domain-containing protein n=1 Tax=Novosphingobium gossypii TaxID=1604774 RepID=UPI003D233A5C